MTAADRQLGMYLHLARASQLRCQPLVRDRMFVLAGATAAAMGLEDVSAECRERVLAHNSQHLVGEWPTMQEALEQERFQAYLRQLRRRYSSEKAEHLLDSLGVEWVNERAAYYTDHEYATALLAATPVKMARTAAPSVDAPQSAARTWTASRRWIVVIGVVLILSLAALTAWWLQRRG